MGRKRTGSRRRMLKRAYRLTNVYGHGKARRSHVKRDKKTKARPPGKRRSYKGKVYYEYRENRADKDQSRRL